jgi:DNA mismatch endonuclease (patch repair protein)
MGRVRQAGTKAELEIGAALRTLGLFYRKNVRSLPGSPDFANRSARWAVFVNGCYWHHHKGCRRATVPKSNRDFWLGKFAANRRRDARALRELRRMGFRVVLVWECGVACAGERLAEILEPRRIGG